MHADSEAGMIIRNTKTGASRHVPFPQRGGGIRLDPDEVIEHIGCDTGGGRESLPAFPFGSNPPWRGLSMRDYFAAKAMQAIIAGNNADESVTGSGAKGMAKDAYAVADAMLEARDA